MALTKTELETLKDFIREGKSLDYIAKAFNTTISNVKVLCHRNNIVVSELRKRSLISVSSKIKMINEADIATRIRVLLGKEIKREIVKEEFTDTQLLKFVGDYNLFFSNCLGVALQDHQKQIIELINNRKRCVIICGRQCGKDFCIACFAIWKCITSPNEKILLISPAQRQSDLLYNRILTFIGASNELYNAIEKSNAEMCRFKNGSEIYTLPSTVYIRGYTEVTYAILNESCWGIANETFDSVEPMLSVKNGTLVLVSSPGGCSGRTWEYFNNPLFTKLQFPSTVNKYLSPEWFELQKQTMPAHVYDMEINAQFSQAIDNYFSLPTIKKCTFQYDLRITPPCSGKYYAGIDWGRTKDSSVITIISKDIDSNLRVENIIEMQNVPFTEQVQRILLLHKQWGFTSIVSEHAGLSLAPNEDLKRTTPKIKLFVPTARNKEEIYTNLLKQMENGKVIIPTHPKLQYELRTFNYEISNSGITKFHHMEGGSDDFVDSLAFAIWADLQPRPMLIAGNSYTPLDMKNYKIPPRTVNDIIRTYKHTGSFNLTN